MLTGAGGLLGDFFSLAIQTLVVMVLVYVLLRDGQAILQRLTRFVLLDHKRTERLLRSVSGTIQASMNGILIIAVSEAILRASHWPCWGCRAPYCGAPLPYSHR